MLTTGDGGTSVPGQTPTPDPDSHPGLVRGGDPTNADNPLLEHPLPDVTASLMAELFGHAPHTTKESLDDGLGQSAAGAEAEEAEGRGSDSESSGWGENDEVSDDEDAFNVTVADTQTLPAEYRHTPAEQFKRAVA